MPSNPAAFLVGVGKPLEIKDAPYPEPAENEIVVKNRSIALNPCDYAMQIMGSAMFPWVTFPSIIGEDVAGDVLAVGSAVTRFKVGDRVIGNVMSAFQKYPVVCEHMAAKIPDSLSYVQASVLPLAFTTAASGLFHKDYLALDLPSLTPVPNGKILLITGGSTSVGTNAIQLAVAAGYEVYTTASPKNFDYVKKLGASHAFDYNSATLKEELAAAFKGKNTAGALAIGGIVPAAFDAIIQSCAAAVTSAEGSTFVALTMVPPKDIPSNIQTKFVDAGAFNKEKELGFATYGDYLTKALAAGTFTAAPRAEIVGNGFEAIQSGMEKLFGERSATKLVVTV